MKTITLTEQEAKKLLDVASEFSRQGGWYFQNTSLLRHTMAAIKTQLEAQA